MEDKLNISAIKVGDEVCYGKFYYGKFYDGGKSIVMKINGHGHIKLEDGKTFTKYGSERDYGNNTLMTHHVYEKLLAVKGLDAKRKASVEEIYSIIISYKSGGGTYSAFDDTAKDKLKELVDSL